MKYVISDKEIKELSKTPIRKIASGNIIVPYESEGFLVDGQFIGDIFAKNNIHGEYEIYIREAKWLIINILQQSIKNYVTVKR